jgi:hypothetical protein
MPRAQAIAERLNLAERLLQVVGCRVGELLERLVAAAGALRPRPASRASSVSRSSNLLLQGMLAST